MSDDVKTLDILIRTRAELAGAIDPASPSTATNAAAYRYFTGVDPPPYYGITIR